MARRLAEESAATRVAWLVSGRVYRLSPLRGVGTLAPAVDDTIHFVTSVRLARLGFRSGSGSGSGSGAAAVNP